MRTLLTGSPPCQGPPVESRPDLVTGTVFKTVVGAFTAPGRVRFPCGSAILFPFVATAVVLGTPPAHARALQAPLEAALQQVAARLAARGCGPSDAPAEGLRAALRQQGVVDAQVGACVSQAPRDFDSCVRAREASLHPTHRATSLTGPRNRPCRAQVLLRRLAEVTPPPALAPEFAAVPLAAVLLDPHHHGRWLLMDPKGRVEELTVQQEHTALRAVAQLHAGPGRYVLQLLVDGGLGPEVAAQADVWAGPRPEPEKQDGALPPVPPERPQGFLTERVRLMRARVGVATLRQNNVLDATARLRLKELVPDGRLVHVDSRGDTVMDAYVAQRPPAPAARLAEVLAAGPTPQAALAALLDSPSHRQQLADPTFTHMGVAVHHRAAPDEWLVVVVLARLVEDVTATAARAQVLRVLGRERRRRGLPPLARFAPLEALAQAHAQRLAVRGVLDESGAGGVPLANAALSQSNVRRAVVQLFRVTRPSEVGATPAVLEKAYTHAAVGAAAGHGVDGVYVVVLLVAP